MCKVSLNCQNIYVCARLFVYIHAIMRRTQVTIEQYSIHKIANNDTSTALMIHYMNNNEYGKAY